MFKKISMNLQTLNGLTAVLFFAWIAMQAFTASASSKSDCQLAFGGDDHQKTWSTCLPLAEQGEPMAQAFIGLMYQYGYGTEQDFTKAIEWYTKSINNGDMRSLELLADLYRLGYGTNQDLNKALDMLIQAIEVGVDTGARSRVEQFFLVELGIPEDINKALNIYERAANVGILNAQMGLYKIYSEGIRVPKDDKKARRWLQSAANGGNAEAQFQLGLSYEEAEQWTEAIVWYKKSAAQEHVTSMQKLARAYTLGNGVAQDYEMALNLFRKAADKGAPYAMYSLGVLYESGMGVSADVTEAVYWYKKASEEGSNGAQISLSLKYWVGNGVMQDYVYAHMWMNIAAVDSQEAREYRDKFESQMTKEQIAEAQKLARECQRKEFKGC
ncbi:sel1 repeat family protein [Pseudidiomarina sp. GXY010]|uniref:Sel1 repeat family protein n=1 Tax=Pseudidiomarina fusca TaxID=2965078 RepID=A0ABU3KZT0_9GAMM|nr:tetratricopeptide repeat protein [Pseudidiomarina sp. GXY010]MDT7526965.1 sel1 repeat family protein [Pseudidiomarina sp. GXY010]